ncbi:ABC transporter permease [Corynebacterium cystitidis]|uniref:ABC transporter permease n=1 Tax=Corynebacterium cystitidis TaxID=35757 RepID=UPI00211DFCD1|nr:ABC transporter permease [Corynebacterium cystitidis]
MTTQLKVNTAAAITVHAGRHLKRWWRTPSAVFMGIGMPLMMILVIQIMFSGMIETFAGQPMNMAAMSVLVAVSQAFTVALVRAGGIVQERHAGLPARFSTLPSPPFTGILGMIVSTTVISFIAMLVAVGSGLVLGADFGSLSGLLGCLLVLVLTAISAGCVGVMLGYLVDTPQGAMSFVPLVMLPMFFNTAMMPREMYLAAIRPLVDISPVTVTVELVRAVVDGAVTVGAVWPWAAWFGGLALVSLLVLARKVGARQ